MWVSPTNRSIQLFVLHSPKMTLSLLFIITISFLSLLAYYRAKRPRLNLPPGPTPWPVLGNLYQLKPLLFRCFHEWAQIFGPIMSVWYGSNLNIVVSSSELAKEVLKDCDQELANRYRIKSQVKFTKNGMDLTWADYGPHYVTVRKVCTCELFSNKKIEASRPLREDEVTGVIESIHKDCKGFIGENHREGMITLRKYMAKAALNHVTRLTFGKSFFNPEGNMDEQGQEFMDILHEVRTIKRLNMLVESVPWLQWIFPPYDQAFDKHVDRLTRFAKEIMEEDNNRHFVQALVSSKDKYDLGQDTIVGLLWDLIIAGMDTVAITVEWAMAELVMNPRVQQKAQEELDNVIGQKRTMTEEDIQNLPYLQATVKEALRLHPPTPLMLPHRANADVKIGGYDVPKGTTMIVNVWAIARDPNIWPDPDAFCPERFLNEDIDVKGHDFRLLPFGTGRRVCPGAQLGLNLVTLMLGRLLHHFNWISSNSVDYEEIDMSESPGIVTYMATPLQVVPLPRLNAHLCSFVGHDDIVKA